MEFENLQAIWDTQHDKPVFAMKDPRLVVALYQQREQSRRRLFRQQFAPMYVAMPLMVAGVGFIFFAFFMKSLNIKNIARDFPMSAWDGVAFAVAAGAFLAVVAPMYLERKKHERTQNVFAPSLREELDRGIAQLDFEMGLQSTPRVLRTRALVTIGAVLFVWEAGRLNGDPAPWWLALVMLVVGASSGGVGLATTAKKQMKKVLARKRALESMRAALDEER